MRGVYPQQQLKPGMMKGPERWTPTYLQLLRSVLCAAPYINSFYFGNQIQYKKYQHGTHQPYIQHFDDEVGTKLNSLVYFLGYTRTYGRTTDGWDGRIALLR